MSCPLISGKLDLISNPSGGSVILGEITLLKCLHMIYLSLLHLPWGHFLTSSHLFVIPSLQSLWNPASGKSRETTVAVRLVLFLHRYLLHGGLRGRHAPDLALQAAGGHPHLRCPGGAPAAGELT